MVCCVDGSKWRAVLRMSDRFARSHVRRAIVRGSGSVVDSNGWYRVVKGLRDVRDERERADVGKIDKSPRIRVCSPRVVSTRRGEVLRRPRRTRRCAARPAHANVMSALRFARAVSRGASVDAARSA
jgi:hypothetical protein